MELKYFENITPEMTKRVNELIDSDFENATREDIELYADWKVNMALQSETFKTESELLRKRTDAHIEIATAQAELSKTEQQTRLNAAREKLAQVRKQV